MDPIENKAEEAEEAGDLLLALRLWKHAAENRPTLRSFCRYGRVAQQLKRWDEAESAFAEALRLDPNDELAMRCMGSLWFTRTDGDERQSLEVAKEWFLKALASKRNTHVLTFLGSAYLALGDVAPARDAYEEALQIESHYEEAMYNLAILEAKENPQRAIELLEKAIEIDPGYAIAHQELGKLLHKAGDLAKAEYHLRRSLAQDPSEYWSQLFLANVLAVQGRIDEAEQTYRTAINTHSEIKAGTDFFVRFLETIGKKEEAAILREQMGTKDN